VDGIRKNFFSKSSLLSWPFSWALIRPNPFFDYFFSFFIYIIFGLHLLVGALRTVVGTIRSGCTHLINLFLISLQTRDLTLLFTESVNIDVGRFYQTVAINLGKCRILAD
jgi:hypothetical protein